ncbi:hypothetical protein BgiMline_032823, partial [Biomphalaria glabrata]
GQSFQSNDSLFNAIQWHDLLTAPSRTHVHNAMKLTLAQRDARGGGRNVRQQEIKRTGGGGEGALTTLLRVSCVLDGGLESFKTAAPFPR